jgi:uncharacterized protein YecE (DUF72 family)
MGRKGPMSSKAGPQAVVQAAMPQPKHVALREALPPMLRLGTSSWNFPGWAGLVWDAAYPEATLSRHGLGAYAQHPLLRCVSLDRAFYRPLTTAQYQALADQVPDDFRFVVKAPSLVCDALVRHEGVAMQPNSAFLNPALALDLAVRPARAGLGHKLGALVFQLSPLPRAALSQMDAVRDQLHHLLAACRGELGRADGIGQPVLAVEVRDPAWIDTADAITALAALLRDTGATYCLGSHAKLPPLRDQLPVLRALWPGPLVCRWNLHARHGAFGYADAKAHYAPFNQLHDIDTDTRATLVKVALATARAGHDALITINNKAEGSAPLSVLGLAAQMAVQMAAQD